MNNKYSKDESLFQKIGDKSNTGLKIYTKPILIAHGTINQMTLGRTGSNSDGLSPNPRV